MRTNTNVFVDPTGKRRHKFQTLALATSVLLTILGLCFLSSLVVIPALPGLQRAPAEFRPMLAGKRPNKGPAGLLPGLQSKARARAVGQAVVAAYYAPWKDSALNSLRQHATNLTMVMAVWLHLTPDGRSLDLNDFRSDINPHTEDVLNICATNQVKIVAVLNNASGSDFDPIRVHKLLAEPRAQVEIIEELAKFLSHYNLHGLQLDLENLNAADLPKMPAFLEKLSEQLHQDGRILQTAVEVSSLKRKDVDWKGWAESVDGIVLMDYDEHASEDSPGPIASLGWSQKMLSEALDTLPADKMILGIGNYGYDWNLTKDPKTGQLAHADSLSYLECLSRAADHPEMVTFTPEEQNGTFRYLDVDNKPHEVWFLDAVTAANQWKIAQPLGLQGAALWVLGSEDPALWTFFDDDKISGEIDFKALEKMDAPFAVDFTGYGEILQVQDEPAPGIRKIDLDPKTGLAVAMTYERLPRGYRIKRSGYQPMKVVLTFDDGPAPIYTEQILDKLKEYNVPGVFFELGQNAERFPELLQRIVNEGHELGNHSFSHPNLGLASEHRVELELTLTQRIFQSMSGRGTLLFRPPYNADAEPSTAQEVRPVALGARLGYITVGELLDPEDWRLEDPLPDGTTHRRTAQDIVDDSLLELKTRKGNCLLLHDGGGDRSATVAALDILIPELRRRGYKFISLSELTGISRDALMPPVGTESPLLLTADRTTFLAISWFQSFLSKAFLVAIFLGALRVILITLLALRAVRVERRRLATLTGPPFQPKVAVLIAAYNESKVLLRTVESVLSSDYPNLEVVVVDDGSTDGTAEVLQTLADDKRIRCIIQENSGKAGALNRALEETATGEHPAEVVFCIDADTIVDRAAIGLLAAHFSEEKVGAVAGNVKVGNRINLVTIWQSIEYITSQNLDRRGYALLNAVPVVPGAVGAWRREALQKVGGYTSDTLAEDMDLTMRLREAGYVVRNESRALAFTEAPDNLRGLFKQRFRWAYGSLQCLWKHRASVGHFGWFGWVVLPSLWLFQIFTQLISPMVDVQILWALASTAIVWANQPSVTHDWQPLALGLSNLSGIVALYLFFLALEAISGWIAFRLDGENPRRLIWLFTQRVVYRQLMYFVVLGSLLRAAQGLSAGWSKLERKGTVEKR